MEAKRDENVIDTLVVFFELLAEIERSADG